jgi:hypothetical protein
MKMATERARELENGELERSGGSSGVPEQRVPRVIDDPDLHEKSSGI